MPGLIDGVEPIRQTGCVIIPSVLFSAFIRHLRLEREGDKGTEDEKKKKKKKKGKKKKKKKKKKGNKLSENDARLLYARRMK